MATEKKKIPCRVCGKMFEPCGYCQSHSDTFRWRNFACSIVCANKYLEDTKKYRESKKIVSQEKGNTKQEHEYGTEKVSTKRRNKKDIITEKEDTNTTDNDVSAVDLGENSINMTE